MKSKYIILTILIVSLTISIVKIVSIDKKNKELLTTVNTLESKINMIHAENLSLKENMKPKTLTYINYKYKYRFIEKEIKVYQSPDKEFSQIDLLSANYAVEVEDAVQIDYEDVWLYIKLPKSYESFNIKGWVREKDTIPITKENQLKIISEVTVKAGSKAYYMVEFDEIKDMKSEIVGKDIIGTIVNKKAEYFKIGCVGGMELWVEEKYITYPPIE